MPASGKKDQMSESELEQRSQASRTHGAYAIQAHGEQAMTEEQRSYRSELLEKIKTKEGAVDVLREMTVDAMVVSKVVQSEVIQLHESGKPLEDIPVLGRLAAFQNSAARLLTAYIAALSDDKKGAVTADMVLDAIEKGVKDATEQNE